ncbi:NADPH-dependent ferric-chelate reductase [compost metagenome]
MPHQITKIIHPLKLRRVIVKSIERPYRHVARIVFMGDELEGFVSASPEDHVKLFLPAEGQLEPTLPTLGPEGPMVLDGATPPVMRDYTPLHFDATARELTIEFVLHGEGPGARWASKAKPGDVVGIGGPRASAVIPYDFAGYLIIGDESSLPAISRRLAEMPSGIPVTVIIEVEGPEDERQFESAANVQTHWLHRGKTPPGEPETFLSTVRSAPFPPDPFYTWVMAAEDVVRAVRHVLTDERNVDRALMYAKAYWK